MKQAVTGLDPVVVMVDGIDAAEAAYTRLGFQVQPRGFHKKLGTANHLMIFDTDYFEILGIVEDTEFNAERREWLKAGGGLANVALATDSADLAYEAFKAAARRAAVLGCEGKWAIHPSQIQPALDVFSPSREEVDRARRIEQAYREAESAGLGAVQVDGVMIDVAVLRLTRNTLRKAELIGM